MPADNYASVEQLKAELRLTDTTDDERLERVIDAVSREIDNYCERRFWQTDPAAVRRYTATCYDELWIDDAISIATVKLDAGGDGTYETTWTVTTDYLLEPYDAAEYQMPYTRIVTASRSGKTFPINIRRGVEVTGAFGWPEIPAPVTEACLIQASRIFKRADAPFGVAPVPSAEGGGIRLLSHLDADVCVLLGPYRRSPIGVA